MIQDAIMQARRMHRALVEATYEGQCNIYERQPYKDSVTKVTSYREIKTSENIPCRLSYSSSPTVSSTGTVPVLAQEIKLFLNPETVIEPGSRIEVKQNGQTECYSQSSKPAVYPTHQEIRLDLWKGYA